MIQKPTYTKLEILNRLAEADTQLEFEAIAFEINDEKKNYCLDDLNEIKWVYDRLF